MKTRRIHLLATLTTLVAATIMGCGKKGNAETAFWVRGNCEMCEATIEKAVSGTPGVAYADYDLELHNLYVSYDSTKVTVSGLHAAVAGAGYESKLQPAVPEAYAALPKCCKKPEDQ